MSNKINMKDIAKKTGVSTNTVSLALRGVQGISEQTRKLILDTAKEMGYVHKNNFEANSLAGNICLIMPHSAKMAIDFFGLVQLGIEAEAKRNNYNTFIHFYDENSGIFEIPLCIKEQMISGIITLGRVSENTAKIIHSFGLPVIMADQYFDDLDVDCVLTDNYYGAYKAVEYLIKEGHRDIGFVGDISLSISFYDRYQGYLKALNRHNILYNPLNIINKSLEFITKKDLSKAIKIFTDINNYPSAFFCCNDAEAIALYKIASQLNINIPKNISVLGFDDIALSKSILPELTTMHVEKEYMGKLSVRQLISRIDNFSVPKEKLLISTKLIIRNSVQSVT